jgi:hypothetical protein
MLAADCGHQHVTDGQLVVRRKSGGILTQRRHIARADQIKDRRLDQHFRGGVRRKKRGQVLGIKMVWMLVGHQHRVKIS